MSIVHHPAIAHPVRFAKRHAHETTIAAIPLAVDFHPWIAAAALVGIVAVYIFEEVIAPLLIA